LLSDQLVIIFKRVDLLLAGCAKLCTARDLSTKGVKPQKHCEVSGA